MAKKKKTKARSAVAVEEDTAEAKTPPTTATTATAKSDMPSYAAVVKETAKPPPPAKRSKVTTATTTSKTMTGSKPDPVLSLLDELLPPEPGMEQLSTARVLLVGAALLAMGTIGFYYIPGMIKKDVDFPGNHLINAFYCAAITLTTVGFGDICPGEIDTAGKVFLLIFSFAGLGIFCGPIVQLGAAWRHAIPGGLPALGSFVLGMGVTIYTVLEGLNHFEAVYASIITGTTIGFGDITPKTDLGKVCIALYATVSVHAVAILLDPARKYLEELCRRPRPKQPGSKKKKVPTKQD